MSSGHSTEARTRSRGLAAAAALAVVFLGGVGYFLVRGGTRPAAPTPATDAARPVLPSSGDPTQPEFGATQGSDIQIVDKHDPTRVAARLKSKTSDPLPDRRFKMTEPQAWVYARNGRTVHIRSDEARVYQPQRGQAPESGTLIGNVVVTIYQPRTDGEPIQVGVDLPVLTATTPTLSFDLNLGELSTPERILVKTDEAEFAGTGLKALFNELKERIELVEIKRGEYLKYFGTLPGAAAGLPPSTPAIVPAAYRPQGQPREPSRKPATPAKPAKDQPADSFYHLAFNDRVVVTRGVRRLNADRLQVWARLLDNRLPPGAIAPLDEPHDSQRPHGAPERAPANPPGGSKPLGSATPRPDTPPAAAPAPPAHSSTPPQPSATREPVVMTWTGMCVLRPLEERPGELRKNDVSLRATAETSGLVTFADAERDAEGHCATLDYGLTSRELTLAGVGPASVTLSTKGQGSVELVRATLDLAAGMIHADGPGLAKDLSGLGRQLSWTQQADLVLRVVDGRVTTEIQEAIFIGAVQGGDADSALRGQTVRAEFVEGAGGKSVIRRLHVEDPQRALARSALQGSLKARVIDAEFDPDSPPDSPAPTLVTAVGEVEAQSKESVFSGGFLEARLTRDDQGKPVITHALARENARFSQGGTAASADEIRAEPGKQVVDLAGPGAFVSRDGTRIAAPQIHLDGVGGRIEAYGPWTFEHSEGRSPSPDPQVRAQGTKAMTFDDRTGLAECSGQVVVVHAPDRLTMDKLTSERVKLELTPATAGQEAARRTDRKLLRATAIGAVEEVEGGANAKAESRRYVADAAVDGGRRLERLMYLEGPRILGDEEKSTLDVPRAGRMLIVDQRASTQAGPTRPAPALGLSSAGGNTRGDALFDWDGSLHLDRAGGTLDIRRNVRLTHRPLDSGETVNLVCERLVASVRPKPGPGGTASDGNDVELTSATAEGAVYVASGVPGSGPAKELAADKVVYDATTGVLDASASDGNVVTLFDAARAVPITAASLRWDLRKDDVRITKPGPIVMPR
jgi:hypothetical protein